MKTVAIVQARTSSTRLPGKVLFPLGGVPMIAFQLDRLSRATCLDKVILATSNDSTDDYLSHVVSQAGYCVFRGSLTDVLQRYSDCASKYPSHNIVRITGDCPLIDPSLVDELVGEFISSPYEYIANNADPDHLSVPDGFDAEVFESSLLHLANASAILPSEREHVTPWMKSNLPSTKWKHFIHSASRDFYRVTVDDPVDYDVVNQIVSHFSTFKPHFDVDDVVAFLSANPSLAAKNLSTLRNEGYFRSLNGDASAIRQNRNSGAMLWNKAKKLIPGGNMLLSKRSEMFLPGKWPSYFSRSKGCKVWDLDGREFTDMTTMSIGTNSLGYGHPEVDAAAVAALTSGNMATLNCSEEVYLAERLLELHPWAHMVRFARSGGEANAIAIRIARAATGRDAVAICGYHGWHDWYLATNLTSDSALQEHLLPGLAPLGVPRSLAGTTHPFSYNSFSQLLRISDQHDLAAVKMEVQRSNPPDPGFLESIRDLCSKKGIVLIFDECSSGFRETYGGLHLKYGVNPDLAMFGKALGNGYAITSIIGRSSIMEAAQNTFISSTFWTERIGPAAALKTLEVMDRVQSWNTITGLGKYMQLCWKQLADAYALPISISGIPALTSFAFQTPNSLSYKTLITQEMLKKDYLASHIFYPSIAHSTDLIDRYIADLQPVFELIARCEAGESVDDFLEGPVCHSTFSRLN